MFDYSFKAGTTSQRIQVLLRDSITGGGKTSVAYTAVTASYCREGGTRQAVTLASGSPGDAYSSGKWAEVDSSNQKGLYQLHVPDAALASGAKYVTISLQATGVIDKALEIELPALDLYDAVRAGLSALPNAAAEAAGGLYTRGTGAGQIAQDASGNIRANVDTIKTQAVTCGAGVTVLASVGTAATNTAQTGDSYALANGASGFVAIKNDTGAVATTVWNALLTAITTTGSIGKLIKDYLDAAISTRSTYAGGDTAGTTTLLSRIAGAINITGGKLELTSTEHTAIATDAQTGLTAQGYTTGRAPYLDTLNGLVAAIWDALLTGITTVGSIGKLLKDNLDAAISTRSTYAGADTAGTTTLLSRIASAINITSGKVELTSAEHTSIAADAQTGLTAQGYTTGRAPLLDRLDAAVTSRLASSSYTAPPSTTAIDTALTASHGTGDWNGGTGGGGGSDPWQVALPDGYPSGTAGALLVQAAVDPLGVPLPSGYGTDTAGGIIGALPQGELAASYSFGFGLALGLEGLTLEAQILDSAGTPVGIPIGSGFSEEGDGNYYWYHTDFPAGFHGRVRFQDAGGGTVYGIGAVDPPAAYQSGPGIPDIEAYLASRHGLGPWGAAVGTGDYPMTIRLRDNTGAPIIGALVAVQNSDGSATVAGPLASDVLGRAIFNLQTGSYRIIVESSARYQTLAPQAFTVPGDSPVYTLLPSTATAPPTCNVSGLLRLPSGGIAANTEVRFTLPAGSAVRTVTGQILMVATENSAVCGSDGRFALNLVRTGYLIPTNGSDTGRYRVTCPALRLDAMISVPDQGTADLWSLL